MRRLLWVLTLGHAGCESCDFSFGPIPFEIRVTPADAGATVIVCSEDGKELHCGTFGPTPDTGTSWNPTPTPPGTFRSVVGWDGYVACRYPELEVDVTAPGCAPAHVFVPRQKPPEGVLLVEVTLDCS